MRFQNLPILPIQANRLTPLVDKARSASSAILQPGSHEDGALKEVLIQLGCQVVDTSFPIPISELLSSHVHSLSGVGVLEALLAVATTHGAEQGDKGQTSRWDARLERLGACDRSCLRLALLTDECLKAISGLSQPRGQRLLNLLKELPMYESAASPKPLSNMNSVSEAALMSSSQGCSLGTPCFVSLRGDLFIEPLGFDASSFLACYAAVGDQLLPGAPLNPERPTYVRVRDDQPWERALLSQYLGVRAITASDMFTQVSIQVPA